jgi:DNA-binding HxlR family transcriptional regulator
MAVPRKPPGSHDTSERGAGTVRGMASDATDATTLERTLQLVGDRWSILIIRAALRGLRRFDEYQADLGIARPILTNRLRRLVDGGVMAKEQYQARPPRYEYRLTPAGVALSPALVALIRWGEHHLADGDADIVLVHGPCGTELEQGFWCRHCATTFQPTAIRAAARDRTGS